MPRLSSNKCGLKFGRLTVLSKAAAIERKGKKLGAWECLCDCGKNATIPSYILKPNVDASCGCRGSGAAKKGNKIKKLKNRLMVYMHGGRVMTASLEDEALVRSYTWSAIRTKKDMYYAGTQVYDRTTKKSETLLFHRQIVRPPEGMVCDHINGDKMNNLRSNLRAATYTENARNALCKRRGVYFDDRGKSKPWYARITVNKTVIQLGCFATKNEAINARLNAEKIHFGDITPRGGGFV